MFFATRNRMPSGALVTAAAGTNYVCSKIVVSSPSYRTNTFRFHFSGFASTEGGNSPQETVYAGNATVIDGLLIRIGGVFHACSFAGTAGVVIPDQSQGVWSDPLTLADAVVAETEIEIWLFYHTDAGQMQLPLSRIQSQISESLKLCPPPFCGLRQSPTRATADSRLRRDLFQRPVSSIRAANCLRVRGGNVASRA